MHTYTASLFKYYEYACCLPVWQTFRIYWFSWIVCILIAFLVWRIFFFSRHPFWDIQPVFHYRNWTYWFYDHGILRKDMPQFNRFVNHACIQTYTYHSSTSNNTVNTCNAVDQIKGTLPEVLKNECVALLRTDYNRSPDVHYIPTAQDVWCYFEGHSAPCFISTYIRADPHIDASTHQIQSISSLRAIITSRPMHVQIRNGTRSSTYQCMNVYYVDFLCVSKKHRHKNIAPEMIQTHEYNQSYAYLPISVSIFKREEELTNIVPIVLYPVFAYSIPTFSTAICTHVSSAASNGLYTASATTCPILVEGENAHTVLVSRSNFAIYISALTSLSQQPSVRFFLSAITSNHLECIENGQWHIFMLIDHPREYDTACPHGVTALYFFRNTCIAWKEQPVLSLFASCRYKEIVSDALFLVGATTCISILHHMALKSASNISNKQSNKPSTNSVRIPFYSILCIESIGDNTALSSTPSLSPLYQSNMAYYFYNFAHRTFSPSQCLILA